MPPAWSTIWTLACIFLHFTFCTRTHPVPSVATYVEGQQVIITLNYSKWSGYFNNQIQFATGDALFDTANTSWSVNTNFTVVSAPVNSSTTDRRVLVLDQAINYTSVYENVTAECVAGAICCSSTSAALLAANTMTYTAYHLGVPQTYRQFLMNVLVQQAGQPPQSLQFHPWQSSTPDENISDVNASAVISTGGVTDDAALAQSAYHLFLANTTDEGFMVNTSCIGSGANQIGMELSSWQACYHCGQAQGTCTAVQGGTPYDQFSSFRSNSLASVLATAGSNCSWVGNSVMTNGSAQYPVQQVACDYPAGQLSVTLQLNATAFGVIPTLPLLSLVNSGQFTWLPGSLTGSIYFTVANSGYQGGWVGSGALGCCSNVTGTIACGSSSGISVSAFQNVTIASESLYQYIFNITLEENAALTSICTFSILNDSGNSQRTTAVQFTPAAALPAPPGLSTPLPPPAGQLPPSPAAPTQPPEPVPVAGPPSIRMPNPPSPSSPVSAAAVLTFVGMFSNLGEVQLADASFMRDLVLRYRQCLANTAGLSLSSVTVTTQQAGSLVLPTALAFPAPTPLYTTLASSMEASLRTNPPSAFTSDPSFASQYGPVTFQGFSFVGPGGTALSPGPPDAAGVEGSLDSSPSEGSLDSSPGAPGLQALGEVLRPIEAAKLARIEGYGTFIPVNGYSPPPPPPNPPSSPPSPPLSLPPGATAAPTVTATPGVASPGAATPTPTPAPAETSSSCSFGAPNCGPHGQATPDCSCTCNAGWSTYPEQDLASYEYCTVATSNSSASASSSGAASGSGSSSGTSSSFGGWLSGNIGDFSGYLISFLVVTCIALAISYYCWPQRTKKCLGACCFGCLNCCKALSRKAGHRGASKRQKKKKENCKAADSDSDTPSEDEAGSDDGESVKSRGKKGKNRGSRGGNRGDDDVDPEFKAKAVRNALYEQDEYEDDEHKEDDSARSHSSKKGRKAKSGEEDSGRASRRSTDSSSSKKGKPKKKKPKKTKNRDASSEEEEAVQGPQLTNIMQIMEQQQRMMQATLQAQFEPMALMPAPQQMQRQRQPMYQQRALMPAQHMQPATQDIPSMHRQLLAWQQQRQPTRQLMQLPYTSHSNPASQHDMYADDQEVLTPDEAYITAMQGQVYLTPELGQQQAAYAASTLRQQQPTRPVSPYMTSGMQQQRQPQAGQMLNYGMGPMQHPAAHVQTHVNKYGVGGNQVQHAMQAAPDRLGITPMQLAMLQQQRLQGRANNLVVSPSIHSVTSSNRSWSDVQ